MVALRGHELASRLGGGFLLVARREKQTLHTEERNQRQNLLAAPKLLGLDYQEPIARFQRQCGHGRSALRQLAIFGQRPHHEQLVQCATHCRPLRRLQKRKVLHVTRTHGLEAKCDGSEGYTTDFWHGSRREGKEVGFCVQTEALARSLATRAPSALPRLRPRRFDGIQHFHATPSCVFSLLDEARVDHVPHAVDGNGRFGNVGGQQHLASALRRRGEGLELRRRRQRRVQLAYLECRHAVRHELRLALEDSSHVLDVLLTGEKDEDVAAWGLINVNLQHGREGCINVVPVSSRQVEHLHRMLPPRDAQRFCAKVLREELDVERCGHDDHAQLRTRCHSALDDGEQHIRAQRTLVRLVQHDYAVTLQCRVNLRLPQQHAVSCELDGSSWSRRVVETDRVANTLADASSHLLCHALRDRHRRNAARLRHHDKPLPRHPRIEQKLRDLRGLARARLADDDRGPAALDERHDLLAILRDRQAPPRAAQRVSVPPQHPFHPRLC
mmetsp:Transcript_2472/g.8417  ORF Transcript_2472/g.8417 Transcript_2472/m.8417 type:complete len:500 (-) Transcript_2472:673-2172(-)